jgi:hypothetical protein
MCFNFPIYLLVSTLLLATGALGQTCGNNQSGNALNVEFQSTLLRRELSGFCSYTQDASVPPVKYQREAWTGTARRIIKHVGIIYVEWSTTLNGAWEFSSADYSNSNGKTDFNFAHQPTVYGPDQTFFNQQQSLVNQYSTFFANYLNSGCTLTSTSASISGQLPSGVIGTGIGHVCDSDCNVVVSGTQNEVLSDPFTVEEAIARAADPSNIRAEDISNSRLQYWDNYWVSSALPHYPPARGPTTLWYGPTDPRRINPVYFHATSVAVKIEIPLISCGGEYKLSLEFVEWPIGQTEPSIPNLPSLHIEEPIIPDQERITYWPSETTYHSYEECGLPLKQGYNQKLVSAKLTPLSGCSHLGAGHGGGGLGGR